MRRFKVKEGDKEREVLIVGTPEEMNDKSHMDYLEEAQREKTSDQLKKLPDKPKSKTLKKDVAGILKERIEFRNRKARGEIKKYY